MAFSYRIDSIVTDRTLKNIGTFSSYEEFLTNGILFFAKRLKKKNRGFHHKISAAF